MGSDTIMNDYTCTCTCGCVNPADDFVCHNCKIEMCNVGIKKHSDATVVYEKSKVPLEV